MLCFTEGNKSSIADFPCRFAETELVVMLTILIMRYNVEVKGDPKFSGETFEERKARVLATRQSLSLT